MRGKGRVMKPLKLKTLKLSPREAASIIVAFVASVSAMEWRGLYALDHPKPKKISCIGCHSDGRTLKAMADKAGDPLYLVHSGQLSERELKTLMDKPEAPTNWVK